MIRSSIKTTIAQVTLMKPAEQRSAFMAFAMVFLLMAVYFVLRPVRDAMASDWTDSEVSLLWNIQFFISTGIVMLYCWCISRVSFKRVVPMVYGLFALSFLGFYLITQSMSAPTLVEKTFYLWVTAFSLLNLSVFWSFMSNTFSVSQGKRLFPFIGAGASAGAIAGPAIPALFAESLGVDNLMLLAALGLMAVIPMVYALSHSGRPGQSAILKPEDQEQTSLRENWWTGFVAVLNNRYLLLIAVFILLYVLLNGFVYFQQKNVLAEFSRADRTRILGGIDWLVNVLTFVFAFVLTGRMVRRLGMGLTLASVPLLMVTGLLVLAFVPTVVVLLAIQVSKRVGNYAITRPGREMLFTRVTQDERFKAKPVIDVVVYRGGDALSASLFALLTDGLGLGLLGMSLIGSLVAAAWAVAGLYLGRRFNHQTIRQNKNFATKALTRQLP
jgi:AAA family ATP:ADP antiporter